MNVLVTGATDGLGRALAHELASRGATVLVHGRSGARLAKTLEKIQGATGSNRVRIYRADFASLTEVRRLAEEVERDHERLDRLQEARAQDQAYDPAAHRRLWRLSEELTRSAASKSSI